MAALGGVLIMGALGALNGGPLSDMAPVGARGAVGALLSAFGPVGMLMTADFCPEATCVAFRGPDGMVPGLGDLSRPATEESYSFLDVICTANVGAEIVRKSIGDDMDFDPGPMGMSVGPLLFNGRIND
jgi:hypothetical protein